MLFKKYCYFPLLFVLFVGLFYVFFNASIGQIFYPFAFGLIFALIWVNQKTWLVCLSFCLAGLLAELSAQSLLSCVITCLCVVVPYCFHLIIKRNIKIWEMGIFVALSQIYPILLAVFDGGNFIYCIVNMVLGILFFCVSVVVIEAVLVKGLTSRFTMLEISCGGIFLCFFASGLVGFNIEFFSFLKVFVALAILITAYCFDSKVCIITAVLIGLGTLFATGNPIFVAPFLIWAMMVLIVRPKHKLLMCCGLFIAEVVSAKYFDLYYNFTYLEFLNIVLAFGIFVAIPATYFEKISKLFFAKNSRDAVKDVVNRNREILERRLGCLAEVFGEMNLIFKKMVNKPLSKIQIKEQLKREVANKVCEFCPNKTHCQRAYYNEIDAVFEQISQIASERGKISVIDIPNFLNAHCGKVTSIISVANTFCEQFKRYSALVGTVDTSKLLIADQFAAISTIFKKLSGETSAEISFDNNRERKIVEELLANQVVCDDVLVYENGINSVLVSLSVRNEDKDKIIIPKIVGKICNGDMVINDIITSAKPNITILNLIKAPRFDCTFGISRKIKTGSESSGDCYSVVKLENNKFLFSVCDGMGSGDKAKYASENAIGLVENFFKAGFGSDLVLSNVNKLLTLQKEEIFAALDICVLDLESGLCDLIKMGAPSGYLINKNRCKIIESGSLPVGIVEETHPVMQKVTVFEGDFLVFVTDGISDAFETDENLASFLCSLKEKNPQTLSERILQRAVERNNNIANDDMTVLVIKVF